MAVRSKRERQDTQVNFKRRALNFPYLKFVLFCDLFLSEALKPGCRPYLPLESAFESRLGDVDSSGGMFSKCHSSHCAGIEHCDGSCVITAGARGRRPPNIRPPLPHQTPRIFKSTVLQQEMLPMILFDT